MKSEVREICGDYALDIDNFDGGKQPFISATLLQLRRKER